MADAPFLIDVRRLDATDTWTDDEPVADPVAEAAGQLASDGVAEEFDVVDFPAWYRDRIEDDPEAAPAPSNPAEAGPSADASMGWVDALAAVRTLDHLEFGAVTVIAGDNGTGKSTLVEAIAIAAGFNPEGGSKHLQFSTYDTHSPLAEELVLGWKRRPQWGWFLRAETFYGMATHIAEDRWLRPTFPDFHRASHGESFLALADSKFRGEGLYFLDEPESALSIQGQRRFVDIMRRSLAAGSQFIVSTHSPLLMAFPDAVVIEVDVDEGLRRTTFDDLASTRAWRGFWHDPRDWFRM